MEEREVISADGTPLSVRTTGDGSPMVLVHGTTGSKESWALVEPLLAEHHTVWSYDRRGRGGSGDAVDYDVRREVDDVRAVLAAAGPSAHLVGHSFGAVCALEAAAADDDCIATLVVYEPPVHAGRRSEPVERAVAHLDAGRREDALVVFLSEVAALSDDEVEMLRSIPDAWNRLLDAAPTAGREAKGLEARPWDPARFSGIGVPTLLVSGELTESPVYLRHDELVDAVPAAEHVVLEGQRHIAFGTDPQSFADAVLAFTRR